MFDFALAGGEADAARTPFVRPCSVLPCTTLRVIGHLDEMRHQTCSTDCNVATNSVR